ncbi:hypothetical protein V5O48_013048 [Marasmius crinis-equi]|uniref:F-box domain-containing protein n=1 Tax=Marasmius crinis-equi TaxID=585013 RepID=A0ABR3F1B2_9AGAR
MELSLEVYRTILKNVRSRADIAALCRVSKGFQYVAERALYNTVFMHDVETTMALCRTLARQPRVSLLVEALTISLSGFPTEEERNGSDDSDEEEKDSEERNDSERGESEELALALAMSLAGDFEGPEKVVAPTSTDVTQDPVSKAGNLPDEYWASISNALRKTNALRHLNIHINGPVETSNTWIFKGCTFRLQSFHCDLDWNPRLISFLRAQLNLHDLYIIDFNEDHFVTAPPKTQIPTTPDTTTRTDTTHSAAIPFLPHLSKLECTFSEAALALIPGRPVTHLKTCFSKTHPAEKAAELYQLFSKIRRSTRRIRALDIADSDYTEEFSMEMLRTVVATSSTSTELRYLGTVVLPIGGRERLMFYGLLMRLPRIACVEFEVSEWDPSPLGVGAPAFKALANELRLYCPTVTKVVFVHEFERTVISYVEGIGSLDMDISPEILWREI